MAELFGPPHDRAPFQQLNRTASRPYRFREYAGRLAWEWCCRLLIRPSPRRAYGWRRFWLARFGAKVENTSRIRPSTRIFQPWKLSLGEHTSIDDGVRIYNLGQMTIGDHSVVSQGAFLCGGTHDHTLADLPLIRSEVSIGCGVWVAADAFVGPGVVIGDNVVVGARAVVTRAVQPGVIVAGNPAIVIGYRKLEAT